MVDCLAGSRVNDCYLVVFLQNPCPTSSHMTSSPTWWMENHTFSHRGPTTFLLPLPDTDWATSVLHPISKSWWMWCIGWFFLCFLPSSVAKGGFNFSWPWWTGAEFCCGVGSLDDRAETSKEERKDVVFQRQCISIYCLWVFYGIKSDQNHEVFRNHALKTTWITSSERHQWKY